MYMRRKRKNHNVFLCFFFNVKKLNIVILENKIEKNFLLEMPLIECIF